MSDPFDDLVDRQAREWLSRHHDRFPVPSFETEWAAARARLSADGLSAPGAPRRRDRRWRWLITVPAAIGAAVVVILFAPPPAPPDQPPPSSPQSGNVVWYTPTDQLLEAPAMRYDAQPARFTYYDPIRMEVIP